MRVLAIFLIVLVHARLLASDCGGGGGMDCGFGGGGLDTDPVAELSKVEETVAIGGFDLKVNRVLWSITVYRAPVDGVLGIFQGDTIAVRVRDLGVINKPLAEVATEFATDQSRLIKSYRVLANGLAGWKAIYGPPAKGWVRPWTSVRYFFTNPSGHLIVFEAAPVAGSPRWSDAGDLVLDGLRRAQPSAGRRASGS